MWEVPIMAAYENEGFCPCNDFTTFFMDGETMTPVRQKVLDILGKRRAYMVYEENKYAWRATGPCSIVEAMLCGDGFLGMEIACLFRSLTPDLSEKTPVEKMPKFLIADHVNPHDICDGLCWSSDAQMWHFFVNGVANPNDPVTHLDNKTILYDDRYLVVVDDSDVHGEQPTVYIDLFKIPQ